MNIMYNGLNSHSRSACDATTDHRILKLSPSVYLHINQRIEEDFEYIGTIIAIHRYHPLCIEKSAKK